MIQAILLDETRAQRAGGVMLTAILMGVGLLLLFEGLGPLLAPRAWQ